MLWDAEAHFRVESLGWEDRAPGGLRGGQCSGCRSERRNKGVSLKQALAAPDVKSAIVRASKLVALCKQMSALRKSDKPKKGVKKTPSS